MKRKNFFKRILAGITMTLPLAIQAKQYVRTRIPKAFKVDAGKDRFGKSISLFEGDTFFCKVSSKDTEGDIYMFESVRVREGGPALHIHYNQDEWWYVLKGQFAVKVGEEVYQLKEGDSVFGPRGVPHCFAKLGEGEGRLLMFFQPAGKMEEYFHAVSEGKLSNMSQEEANNFRKAHGFERVGPPLGHLKQ
ncbi:cupin domain-containing protein [Chryseolinea sp. H1M3-3]|uniref:cupin domain-containing protein n=1 Tax=Chryseolinea sp. H1M3-3 TaxID=3034144 RepID=UPI0023ECB15A|nr:cupin domain-containing protein [Chryseolinea sp. H1M3-3]